MPQHLHPAASNPIIMADTFDRAMTISALRSLPDADLARVHGILHHWAELACYEQQRRREAQP